MDAFIEDGAYTTLAAAVSILLVMVLLFSSTSAVWSMSRAGDTQAAADATAMAGANVVSSYHTAATVVDASILSLGLTGFVVTGVGLAATLVPGAQAAGQMVDAGVRIIKMRNEFASSTSRGLKTLEDALPWLVAANGARACSAQSSESVEFSGSAMAVPRESASEFPALEGSEIETEEIEAGADELDQAATDLARANEKAAQKKEAAWLVDCGREGANMQERAASLSGLSAAENPDYASSLTWEPMVALGRTRAYYRWRRDHDEPVGSGVEARADAAARHAFYTYACEEFADARVEEVDGRMAASVPMLPRNTEEVKGTRLYTDARWPSSYESQGLTLHFGSSCPGATGAVGPSLSLQSIDASAAHECEVCKFSVTDVGKAPAASTSIDNGYEYHLREFTRALQEYADARNEQLEQERRAKSKAQGVSDAFEDAISVLAGKRPRIAPPGRAGCVAMVASGEISADNVLSNPFAPTPELQRRGAISAAALAPDPATRENNVLSNFFSTVQERVGDRGAVGLIDDVMGLWGDLLISYGDLGEGLGDVMDGLLGGLDALGAGPLASWLSGRISGVVRGLGFEPVDLSCKKPVLTDSSNVIAQSDVAGLGDLQSALRSIPLGSTDPGAILQAAGYAVGERIYATEFTLASIPLPGGGSIPLTIRLGDLFKGW
ncbi:hypothetical protein [Collinsella tanakaei]|uniref:hypothetical protein n=1 Tax=Collinsella tanakaei TaxID=626935 RepID=UPI0029423F11|nr:hypothetical protein [Collinsella tanakaei]